MSSRTKLQVVNNVLRLLDMSSVITTTDTHQSRVLVSLMPLTLFSLSEENDWIDLTKDVLTGEFELIVSDVVGNGNSGFLIPYFTRIVRVVDTSSSTSLKYVHITKFERTFPTGFIYTADLTSVTADSDVTVDSDGIYNTLCSYSYHNNTVYIPPTLNWGRVKIVHTKPMTVPEQDYDEFDAPDYLLNLYEILLAYRYAEMYSPARNDFAAARVSGLRNMYQQTLIQVRSRHVKTPLRHKRSLL